MNGRGRTIQIDGPAIDWAGVIVIDHPHPPQGHRIPALACTIPVIVLLRRDWEFLFDHSARPTRCSPTCIAFANRRSSSEPSPNATTNWPS